MPGTPLIETARLSLRPLAPADLGWLQPLNALADVRRYLFDDESWSVEEVQERLIVRNDALWATEGLGLFVVTHRESQEAIGWCGFWYFHEPPVREVCYALHPAHWGSGYAFEAMQGLVGWAGTRGIASLHASVDEPNERSHRLLARLGFVETHRSTGNRNPLRNYARVAGRGDAAP